MMKNRTHWIGQVWLLLVTARRRARSRRTTEAARKRGGYPGIVNIVAFFGALIFQVLISMSYVRTVNVASSLDVEHDSKFAVSLYAFESMVHQDKLEQDYRNACAALERRRDNPGHTSASLETLAKKQQEWDEHIAKSREYFSSHLQFESRLLVRSRGGSEEDWRAQIAAIYQSKGSGGFVATPQSPFESPGLGAYGILWLLLVLWWLSMVLQGEGMSTEATRRRHPMWEWYLSFPISSSAVFAAEALAPVASNPMLLMGPALIAILVGVHTDSFIAGICALPIGIPLVLSAAIWSKATEVLVMLRSSMRNRAGWFAMLSAGGFIAAFLPLVFLNSPVFLRSVVARLVPLARVLPSAQVLIDAGSFEGWLCAMGASMGCGIALAIPAFVAMRFATSHGLESGFGKADSGIRNVSFQAMVGARKRWYQDPLLRKEWLWLRRDRGALIQLIGVPLFLVGLQAFNLHNALQPIDLTWNKLAGVIIGMGGYLLYTAGPRALLSEGPALALTMTWPRSLEDTLRMKVRLLFALVTAMIWVCLGVVMWMFPGDSFKLLLVALAWLPFGLSVAEKAVTLIRQPTQSGASEALSQSQVAVAGLGNLTLAIGIFTAQWQLAIAAIALNWVYAGALWQGFRLRLAYLFDPDSQPQLHPPTILSSVLATVGLMELGAILAIPLIVLLDVESVPLARVIAYGPAAALICAAVWYWHRQRGVSLRDITLLDDHVPSIGIACVGALVLGTALGAVGIGYQHLLLNSPWQALREPIEHGLKLLTESPGVRLTYAIIAIGVAPWAEEFIFRGLMFRAMVPQWGLLRAVVASSAFFTILHPVVAWPMVFCLGALNALVFARTRALLPCVVLHLCYNAVIVGWS